MLRRTARPLAGAGGEHAHAQRGEQPCRDRRRARLRHRHQRYQQPPHRQPEVRAPTKRLRANLALRDRAGGSVGGGGGGASGACEFGLALAGARVVAAAHLEAEGVQVLRTEHGRAARHRALHLPPHSRQAVSRAIRRPAAPVV